MEEQPTQPPKYTTGYEPSRGKPTYAVGGAGASPSPDRVNVVCHLFVEYYPLPSYTMQPIGTDEEEGPVLKDEQEHVWRSDVIRELQATLIMPPWVARHIAQQLNEAANEIEGI